MVRRVGCVLPMLALAILFASLVPGTLVGSWSAVLSELKAAATLQIQEPALVTILERLAAFLLLGALTYREFHRWQLDRPRLAACIALLLFAAVVELAQCAIQERHARLSDLILALAFGAGGVQLSVWLGARPAAAKVRRLLLAALITGNATVTLVVAQSHADAELDGWDCSYPLLVANELTGNRPWLGRIRGLTIYPRALSEREIKRLANLPLSPDNVDLRAEFGALAIYSFATLDERRVPQLLPEGPRMDFVLPAAGSWQLEDDALEANAPILIRSVGAAEICERLMASNAFAVEVEIASGSPVQRGPARIVSSSLDVMQRNFTLGEELGALVVRVRTPWNGPNGTNLPLETEPAVLGDAWHHVVFGYAHATATLFLDGVEAVPPLRYYEFLLLGEGYAMRIAAAAALPLVALGVLASFILPRRPYTQHLWKAYGMTALCPVVTILGYSAWLGHDHDRWLLGAALLAPVVGILAGSLVRERIMNPGHLTSLASDDGHKPEALTKRMRDAQERVGR